LYFTIHQILNILRITVPEITWEIYSSAQITGEYKCGSMPKRFVSLLTAYRRALIANHEFDDYFLFSTLFDAFSIAESWGLRERRL